MADEFDSYVDVNEFLPESCQVDTSQSNSAASTNGNMVGELDN